MTPGQELELFIHDRPAWHQYVAPRMAGVLPGLTDPMLDAVWSRMDRAYQRATWRHLDDATQQRLRRCRGTPSMPVRDCPQPDPPECIGWINPPSTRCMYD